MIFFMFKKVYIGYFVNLINFIFKKRCVYIYKYLFFDFVRVMIIDIVVEEFCINVVVRILIIKLVIGLDKILFFLNIFVFVLFNGNYEGI